MTSKIVWSFPKDPSELDPSKEARVLREDSESLDCSCIPRFQRSYSEPDALEDEDVVALAEAIAGHKHLRMLDLSGQDFSQHGEFWNEYSDRYLLLTERLVPSFAVNTSLREIRLSGCGVQDDGAEALFRVLRTNSTITTLDLANDEWPDDIDWSICEAARSLKFNQTLTELNLTGCKLEDDGPVVLAEALKFNDTLKVLRVCPSGYYLDQAGCDALANDKGTTALADSLRFNVTLKVLEFLVNDLAPDGEAAMRAALEMNTDIRGIEF